MKLLIIDECYYTRLGIIESLKENADILTTGTYSIHDAITTLQVFSPDIVLMNLTPYGYYSSYCEYMKLFFPLMHDRRVYIYLDKPYPWTEKHIQLTNNDFFLSTQEKLITNLSP